MQHKLMTTNAQMNARTLVAPLPQGEAERARLNQREEEARRDAVRGLTDAKARFAFLCDTFGMR